MANFKIGLDAEFVFRSRVEKRMVTASSIFGANTTAKFGTDGCSAIAEIRPTPGDHPVELVENIRKVFQAKVGRDRRVADIEWQAGAIGFDYPLGAHIHIGSQKIVDARNADYRLTSEERSRKRAEEEKLRMDFGIAFDSLVLPFATVMGKEQNEKQRRNNYGKLTDVRQQNWGYEYRSCSSFIASPTTTLAVLTVAWVVANEFLDGTLPNYDSLKLNVVGFARNPKAECERMMKERCKFIMSLPTVRNNEQFQEILKVAFVLIAKKVEFEQVQDMKKAWRLKYEETPLPARPRVMTFEEAWGSDVVHVDGDNE